MTIKYPQILDSNGLITFKIESTFRNDNYLKIQCKCKIDTNLNNYKNIGSSEEYKTYGDVENYHDPSDLVIVYDYKEM